MNIKLLLESLGITEKPSQYLTFGAGQKLGDKPLDNHFIRLDRQFASDLLDRRYMDTVAFAFDYPIDSLEEEQAKWSLKEITLEQYLADPPFVELPVTALKHVVSLTMGEFKLHLYEADEGDKVWKMFVTRAGESEIRFQLYCGEEKSLSDFLVQVRYYVKQSYKGWKKKPVVPFLSSRDSINRTVEFWASLSISGHTKNYAIEHNPLFADIGNFTSNCPLCQFRDVSSEVNGTESAFYGENCQSYCPLWKSSGGLCTDEGMSYVQWENVDCDNVNAHNRRRFLAEQFLEQMRELDEKRTKDKWKCLCIGKVHEGELLECPMCQTRKGFYPAPTDREITAQEVKDAQELENAVMLLRLKTVEATDDEG